ncbi:tail completion protein gp17 [Sphingomonas sanxanigenens]|uniref:DUF3168 domain-containing protein n=1 Tax=Sphingomonas sanxanigenens DSM 19645 = NX02 TaxID=1123269 RepID=W0ACC6_9SPHN|nr:DUF3168 domain-containing protein [Sphingomonas sanxanigenens]AHE55534.1 hypothetical protein NX02_19370 [Sphingomonas sanxanigenens DSM 19645 = NX02]
MDMQAALAQRQVDAAPVAALVGRRIHWVTSPQGTPLPRITMQVITEQREQHYKGFFGMQFARVQIDVRAKSYSEAKALADTVIDAVVPAGTFHGVKFRRGIVDRITDFEEKAGNEQVMRRSLDVLLWHSQA